MLLQPVVTSNPVELYSAIGVGLLNFGGLIWGAASVSSKLKNLDESFREHKTETKVKVDVLEKTQVNHGERIAVVETKLGVHK